MLLLVAGSVVMKQFGYTTVAAVAILGGGGLMCAFIVGQMFHAMARERAD